MLQLPYYIPLLFVCTTLLAFALFINLFKSKKLAVAFFAIIWLALQALLGYNNLYNSNTNALPPKIFVFGVLPTIIGIVLIFTTTKGKQFIDELHLLQLAYIHIVRVPVEIVLYWLFVQKTIPQLMTFEGRNFDIVAGLTAPLIIYFGFLKNKLTTTILLIWNFICLGLLLNIVVNALLSAPSPIQKFAFDQPNIAILNFPFCWLPTFIVPIVLFAHIAAIQKLYLKK